MARIYRKLTVAMYADEKFRRLSAPQPCAQWLWVYLLTGPHTGPIPGLFVAGEAALSEALGWPLDGFREAYAEVFREGMAKADLAARVVWVPKAIEHNIPESPNVIRSWREHWDLVPSCDLKREAHDALRGFIARMGRYKNGKGFLEAFDSTCVFPGKASANPLGRASRMPSPKPSGKGGRRGNASAPRYPSPNQEQEQEKIHPALPHLNLAERLRARILENKPDARVPKNLDNWVNTVRLMVEVDHRDPTRIAELIDWSQAHDFWRTNILSAEALRRHFDRLELQKVPRDGAFPTRHDEFAHLEHRASCTTCGDVHRVGACPTEACP